MTRYSLEWEPIARLLDEGIEDLLFTHWKEVALNQDCIPLAPDWDRARKLEQQGQLKTAVLREDNRIVGYNSFFVTTHIHYRHMLQATNDIIYVAPFARGFAGVRLIKGTEELLRALGVVKIFYRTKFHVLGRGGKTVGDLLEKLGYAPAEIVHSKLLEP